MIKWTFPFTYGDSYYKQVYRYEDTFSFIAVFNGKKAGAILCKLNTGKNEHGEEVYYIDI